MIAHEGTRTSGDGERERGDHATSKPMAHFDVAIVRVDHKRGDVEPVLDAVDAHDLAEWLRSWSDEFAPEFGYMFEDMDHLAEILDLGRHDARPRADLVYARQIMDFISYFFDESFTIDDEYPAEAAADAGEILKAYLESYDHSDDNEQWFAKIRDIATELGYAAKPKDYKKNPDDYKGHVGHVSTVIRIALMGRAQSPDVWAIQQILGEDKVRERLQESINK